MNSVFKTLSVLLFLAAVARAASGAITLGTVDRHVFATSTFGGTDTGSPNTSDAHYDDLAAVFAGPGEVGARQESDIDITFAPLQLKGTGQAFMNAFADPGAYGESFFDVFITLDLPYTYGLTGFLDTRAEFGSPQVYFEFTGPSVNIVQTSGGNIGPAAGLLNPGTYRVQAVAAFAPDPLFSFSGFGQSDFNFTLTLEQTTTAAVPEPTSLVLFGMGLLGLAASRLRRGRRPRFE